jgi:hypothetical protein
MRGSIGASELLLLLLIGVFLLSEILYLRSLQKALNRCSAEARTLSPQLVWLALIPIFNFFWNFVLVVHLSRSLYNEFRRRDINVKQNPGLRLGLAMCILYVLSVIPYVGIVTRPAALICWIVYWAKIAGFSSKLVT